MSTKSYIDNDRRRAAALSACEGLPTEWLERGLVNELYKAIALLALADRMGERRDGSTIVFPIPWWDAHVRGAIDELNLIAEPNNRQ